MKSQTFKGENPIAVKIAIIKEEFEKNPILVSDDENASFRHSCAYISILLPALCARCETENISP